MAIEIWALALIGISSVVAALASVLIKSGSKKIKGIYSFIKNTKLILGFFIYVFALLLYLPAVKVTNLSIAYPISALTYIWVSFLSMYFFKEKMNLRKWVSVFLIILGVVLIAT